jgi:hypothetical protein
MAMATGLRPLAASSSSALLSPSKASLRAGPAALAGHVKMWTAGVRVGAQGMCAGARRVGSVRAAVSQAPTAGIGVVNTDGLPVTALLEALEAAGRRGAEVRTLSCKTGPISLFTKLGLHEFFQNVMQFASE